MSWIKTLDLKNIIYNNLKQILDFKCDRFFVAQMSVTSNEKKAALGKPKYLLFTV